MPGVWGSRTCSRVPTTLPLHLCESLCSRRLCVIFFRSLPPVTSHESPACPEFRGGHGFQTFRRHRILLHFSRCSRTKIGSVILSPSSGSSLRDKTAHLHRSIPQHRAARLGL